MCPLHPDLALMPRHAWGAKNPPNQPYFAGVEAPCRQGFFGQEQAAVGLLLCPSPHALHRLIPWGCRRAPVPSVTPPRPRLPLPVQSTETHMEIKPIAKRGARAGIPHPDSLLAQEEADGGVPGHPRIAPVRREQGVEERGAMPGFHIVPINTGFGSHPQSPGGDPTHPRLLHGASLAMGLGVSARCTPDLPPPQCRAVAAAGRSHPAPAPAFYRQWNVPWRPWLGAAWSPAPPAPQRHGPSSSL